ncbi:Uncharacterised protein [Mycobacteroides abscessus subsp. abscessus]|nr:Uncharacterised protein [Mycobacteroides abscessus subsp. abscessus]
MEVEEILKGVVGGAVEVPVGVSSPVDGRERFGQILTEDVLEEPRVLDEAEVLDDPAERQRRRTDRAVEVRRAQAVDLASEHLSVVLEVVDETVALTRCGSRIVEWKTHRGSFLSSASDGRCRRRSPRGP